MFKKTIKYEDFNGEQQEEDFYFHMSKAELIEMAADGDIQKRLQRIIESKDNRKIFDEFKALLANAVGLRSEDGRTFRKDDYARAQLMESPAFDELVLELCTDAKAATEFVTNLIPQKMQKELQDRLGITDNTKSEDGRDVFNAGPTEQDPRPAWEREDRDPTPAELQGMNKDELQRAFNRKIQRATPSA